MKGSILWDKPKVSVYIDIRNGDLEEGIATYVTAETIAKLVNVYVFNFVSDDGVETCSDYNINITENVVTVDIHSENGTYTLTGNTLTFVEGGSSGDGSALIVNIITDGVAHLDKTYNEIVNAINNGKSVYALINQSEEDSYPDYIIDAVVNYGKINPSISTLPEQYNNCYFVAFNLTHNLYIAESENSELQAFNTGPA